MGWYHFALISLAVVAGISAWNVPHAVLWLGLGAFAYVTSAWMYNAGLSFAPYYGWATNVIICVLILSMRKGKWEMAIAGAFISMIILDLAFAIGAIKSQVDFAIALEVVNALAILLIGYTGLLERTGKDGIHIPRPYRTFLDFCRRALLSERDKYHQWWKHR